MGKISRRKGWRSVIKLEPEETEALKASLRTNPAQLLPGVPDDLSIESIAPKLSWRALRVLSSSSSEWLRATQSRKVYNSRVRARSTETLVGLLDYRRVSALYSMRDDYFVELPPLPGLHLRKARLWRTVSLDGKLYVFLQSSGPTCICSCVEVYLLDLTGQQWQWKHCGTMQEPSLGFEVGNVNGHGAVGGNLYTVRPEFSSEAYDPHTETRIVYSPGFTSEVYDPKSHAWSPRKPMPSVRRDYLVATLGEELLVYGGKNSSGGFDAQALEVYNPLKDEWRVVGNWHPESQDEDAESHDALFTAQGKIYAMDGSSICVHDSENQSWRHLYRCLYPGIGPAEYLWPVRVLAVNDELLAILNHRLGGTCLARSRGFGREMTSIVWEKVELSGPLAKGIPLLDYFEIVSVQL